jgi:nitrite reductase/ring-hydroxylating ferredoxin subunit
MTGTSGGSISSWKGVDGTPMLNRRQFVILTTATAAGCAGVGRAVVAAPGEDERIIDAGRIGDYAANGVYDRFRTDGFFVVRRDSRLFAMSSICPHRGCILRSREDQSFACRCHGSRFEPGGQVTRGPAEAPLPRLAVARDERDHLMVHLGRPIHRPSAS